MKPSAENWEKITCPVCLGSGSLKKPKEKDEAKVKAEMATVLIKSGFSYRQVAKFLGWKSTESVTNALKKYGK